MSCHGFLHHSSRLCRAKLFPAGAVGGGRGGVALTLIGGLRCAALIASGQVAQIPYHLNRAMDNGLTQAQAGEVITHLAFYVGWPNAFSALPVAKDVFDKRSK